MKEEQMYDLILDMVNDGKLVMKGGKVYAPEYAPAEGVYIKPNSDKKIIRDKPTGGNENE